MTKICATRTLKKKGAFRSVKKATLFSGNLHLLDVGWVGADDLTTAAHYLGVSAAPLQAYCSAYGPCSVGLGDTISGGMPPGNGTSFNDATLQSWVDGVFSTGLPANDMVILLRPPSAPINTDADPAQGILGYHGYTPNGHVYCFVNLLGTGLTLDDAAGYYALALSHEVTEATVDPHADLSEPEVSDPCSGNCAVTYLNYFDANGKWIGPSASSWAFFTCGVATPATVQDCPSPQSGCSYDPLTVVPSPTPLPPPPPGPQTCIAQIEQGVIEAQSGQFLRGVEDIFAGIECLITIGVISRKQAIKRLLEGL